MITWNTTRATATDNITWDNSYSYGYTEYSGTDILNGNNTGVGPFPELGFISRQSETYTSSASVAYSQIGNTIFSTNENNQYDEYSSTETIIYTTDTGDGESTLTAYTSGAGTNTHGTTEHYVQSDTGYSYSRTYDDYSIDSDDNTIVFTTSTSDTGTIPDGSTVSIATTTSSTDGTTSYNTTASLATTTSIYTSSINSLSQTTSATTSIDVTVTSNVSTFDDGSGGTITGPATSSSYYNYTTTTDTYCAASVEIGTIVSADGLEWLWSFTVGSESTTVLGGSYRFITNLANSFTQQTFWNHYSQQEVTFLTFEGNATTDSTTITNAESLTTFTTNSYAYTTDGVSTVTLSLGDLPIATATEDLVSTYFATGTFSDGFTSNVISFPDDGFTYSTTITLSVESTTSSTVLFGFENASTGVITASTVATTSYVITAVADGSTFYIASSTYGTTADNGNTTAYSVQFSGVTNVIIANHNANLLLGDSTIFQRVPKMGGMQTPNAMHQTDGTGSNITLADSIYYPFVSSVQENVLVPIPLNTTANDGTNNWSYSWSSFSIYWTSASSYTTASGTSTLTRFSSSTGSDVLSTAGADSGEYWQGISSAFGGYSPVSSAAELAIYAPGGIHATIYDSTGGTVSEKTIREDISTSNFSGSIRVEENIWIYSLTDGGALPFVGFSKYDDATITLFSAGP